MKIKAKGTTIKYGDAASPTTLLGQHSDVTLDLGSWDRTDVTTLDTPGSTKEYDSTMKEPISLDVTGFLDPADAAHAWLIAAHESGLAKHFIVTLPDAGAATFTFQAQVTNLTFGGITPSGHITYSCTLAGTGSATFAA